MQLDQAIKELLAQSHAMLDVAYIDANTARNLIKQLTHCAKNSDKAKFAYSARLLRQAAAKLTDHIQFGAVKKTA